MTASHFERMRTQIRKLHPDLSDAAVQHACNMISNELRGVGDFYEVYLSATPFNVSKDASSGGYFDYLEVVASEKRIFLRLTVD